MILVGALTSVFLLTRHLFGDIKIEENSLRQINNKKSQNNRKNTVKINYFVEVSSDGPLGKPLYFRSKMGILVRALLTLNVASAGPGVKKRPFHKSFLSLVTNLQLKKTK